ncbi:MAG: M23 family metallopeptidase [Clostridia bacterium]|nr:M23 family metallopeptidase [Clostridia bacterium]
MDHAYIVTLGAAVTIIAATAAYTQSLRAEQAQIEAAAQAHELSPLPSASPTMETAAPERTPAPTLVPLLVGGASVRPVGGGVLRGYDARQPVWWGALGCLQVHAALDLAGEAGEAVRCAKDGVVERAVRDDLWGWRVEVAQTDGCLAVYAGLLQSFVTKGQSAVRGQTLGLLMDSIPCEAELGAHLHLELQRGGVSQDPAQLLPAR